MHSGRVVEGVPPRRKRLSGLVVAAALSLWSGVANAQDVALPEPVEPSKSSTSGEPDVTLDVDREIDLANVVTAAAKGVTTVQEAPAIITIITADDLKSRGLRWITEAMGTVPGWLEVKALGNQVENAQVRGVGQAVLLLRDGLSLFDPQINISWLGRSQPMETVKRIEVVTGPGGVLWGANSFLGIANLITKDADDVNGLELSAGYGDGPGNKQDFKTYAMFGKTFLNGRIKLFQHISYETFLGETFDVPEFLVSSPGPQPNGLAIWGTNHPQDPLRSWYVIVDGKYTFGPVSIYYMLPFGDTHPNLTFGNYVSNHDTWTTYDRYAMVEYKDRYLNERVGLSIKASGVQFVRDYTINLFPPSAFFPAPLDANGKPTGYGGFNFGFAGGKIFRTGVTADLDVNLPHNIRLLAGTELFYEGAIDGGESFDTPVSSLPLICPLDQNGVRVPRCPRAYTLDSGRFTVAGYVDAQWRIFNKVTLDGGVRLQTSYGDLSYTPVPLGSAAIVYNFVPDFHLKVNYATGFRTAPFQDARAVPGGVGYAASPLRNETSQAFQGELNARVLRNVRKVRELELRVDYSYSVLSNLIQIHMNQYGNTGKRGIHSVEGYAKLYLQGDHFLQASYTYLYSVTTDLGVLRSLPNHWFAVGGSINIVKNLLDANFNLFVYGAYEDPNRYPSSAAPNFGQPGQSTSATSGRTSDLTFDRLTPVADLQLGLRMRLLRDRFQISAQFYNVLNQHYYYPDNFYDLVPAVELSPTPAPGFNFFGHVSYRF